MKFLLAAFMTSALLSTAAARQPRGTASRQTEAAAKPAGVAPKKVNMLLYGTMERLEILSSVYENFGLRASADTLKKAYELDKAVNKAAASYFKMSEPKPESENMGNYRGRLERVLRSVKILKEVKDRLEPAETESAILAARDLYLAIDDNLSGPKLLPGAIEAKLQSGKDTPSSESGDFTDGTETLFAVSEVTIALSTYQKETGKFPKHLKDLTPKYIPAIPSISIADHTKTAEVVEIDSRDYDADYSKAFKDTGKWLYFSNKKSKYYGRVFVDCTHKNAQGVEFYRTGEKQ